MNSEILLILRRDKEKDSGYVEVATLVKYASRPWRGVGINVSMEQSALGKSLHSRTPWDRFGFLGSLHQPGLVIRVRAGQCSLPVLMGGEGLRALTDMAGIRGVGEVYPCACVSQLLFVSLRFVCPSPLTSAFCAQSY